MEPSKNSFVNVKHNEQTLQIDYEHISLVALAIVQRGVLKVGQLARLQVPDLLGILLDSAIAAEKAHAGSTHDRLFGPLGRVDKGLVNLFLGLEDFFKKKKLYEYKRRKKKKKKKKKRTQREVVRDNVVVVSIDEHLHKLVERRGVAKGATAQSLDDKVKVRIERTQTIADRMTDGIDLIRGGAKDEHVFLANLVTDLNVGTVQSTQDKSSVEDKLHVARENALVMLNFFFFKMLKKAPRAGCLCARRRNVLRNVTRGDDNLGKGNIVVCKEDNLEEVADLGVVVDDLANVVDQLDDLFGHEIARRRLAAKDDDARDNLLALLLGHGFDLEVSVHDSAVQVQKLKKLRESDRGTQERSGTGACTRGCA